MQILNLRTMQTLHYQTYLIALKNYVKNMVIKLQKIWVLPATYLDYIGSLHTLDDCIKYSESTVRIVTDVKPVIFTVNLFAL